MGTNFHSRWTFRGWMVCVIVTFYAQMAASKAVQCEETHYLRKSKCCKKCGPGTSVLNHCTDTKETQCARCFDGEYQPGWTEDTRCLQQKYCDTVKGFTKSPENYVAEEPCRCQPGLQCHPINCEYCEKMPACNPGFGLEADPGSTNERKICVPCKKGFFSADLNSEPCKQWTNCNAEGRTAVQAGSTQTDATCGVHFHGTTPSWVIVSVLSVITVLCLLILLLFCYKDKLKLLSVNLRSCVQNLKRTRIQQETLAPLYHSGAAGGGVGGGPGGLRGSPCEITKLICQTPRSPENEPSSTFPFTGEMTDQGQVMRRAATEDRRSEGSGEPEEVSEEDIFSASPLLVGSCMCVIPIREPLEVGENEDCTQAVSSGMSGMCSCGGLEGQKDGDESKREDKRKRAGSQENMGLSAAETCSAPFVPLSSPLIHTSSVTPPAGTSSDLCLPLSEAQAAAPQLSLDGPDRAAGKQAGLHRLTSTDPPAAETRTTSSAKTSVSPSVTSASVGHLYLDKPAEASSPEQSRGVSWEGGREKKLPLEESELECPPESLHSQLAEAAPTSGLVSGHHNTTFISSGQVMNFSSDVIVVYISQMSQDSDEGLQGDAFGSPVQEEASETAPFFRSSLQSQGDSISHNALPEETLPVQEVMEAQLLEK